MNKVKNIVFTGLHQGWAKGNIISQIKYKIAVMKLIPMARPNVV